MYQRPGHIAVRVFVLLAAGLLASTASRAAYTTAPPADGGTLSGKVTFSGQPPAIPTITTTKNQDVCGATVPDPKATVVNPKDHGVEWAVVSLQNVAQGKAPDEKYTLVNKGCAFHPHVLAAMVGQTFVLENDDPVLHNTHIRIGNRTLLNDALSFHVGDAMYHPIEDHRVLQRTGELEVNCDAHEWMNGHIQVEDNPYFAVTDADGSFKISDIPPGTYTVNVWHENLGEQSQSVSVPAKGSATANFTFPAH
jgi:plastocyanin